MQILSTDSYKQSMYNQMPAGTEYQFSYIESRGGEYDSIMFFGLQMFIKEHLLKPITQEMIDEAEEVVTTHGLPFNRAGWQYILDEHKGFLPLLIKAVPEGTILPVKNVVATIVNTDKKCAWLTSYVETAILRAVWFPSTVGTISWQAKQIIRAALEASSDDPEGSLAFRCHDFGGRGVASSESAGLGAAAHLVNFMGTDTIEGLMHVRRFYGEQMAGFSIPAMEHSTVTAFGRDHEADAYSNMMDHYAKPGAIFACVSDAYDIDNAVENIWGKQLRQRVIDSGATLVIRPDSGDVRTAPVRVVEQAAEAFGYSVNSKGFKVLANRADGSPIVRVIHGDGITIKTIPEVYANLLKAGFSAENLAVGMGGGLLQHVNRDTLKWAMKCSAVCVNGEWRDVWKEPKGEPDKASKKGRLALVHENGEWATIREDGNAWRNLLETVYRNGVLTVDQTFSEIRARSNR